MFLDNNFTNEQTKLASQAFEHWLEHFLNSLPETAISNLFQYMNNQGIIDFVSPKTTTTENKSAYHRRSHLRKDVVHNTNIVIRLCSPA